MNDCDKHDFHGLLNTTFDYYLKPKPENQNVLMYFLALKRFDLEEIREAIGRHVQDTDAGQWLPKAADIIRNITGNTQTQAELAWTKVDRTIRCIGPHQSVCFDDRIIHAVIEDMGGWISLCAVGSEEYPFKHNEFIKRYRGYSTRPPDQVVSKLVGSNEAVNNSRGYIGHIQLPILIGDKKTAMFLLENGREGEKKLFHTPKRLIETVMKKITGGHSDDEQNG